MDISSAMKKDVEEKVEKILKEIVEEANQKETRSALRDGKNEIFRRIVHICIPLTLVYYIVPPEMWGYWGGRENGLLLVFLGALIFEIIRIKKKVTIPGFRHYEAGRLSAAAWASIALFISFTLFPMEIVVPSVIVMGVIDPLNGEMRRSRYYPWIPSALSVLIYFISLSLLSNYNMLIILLLSIIGGVIAMASEIPRLWIDDDFMMIMTPATLLYVLILAMTAAGIPMT